MTPYALAVRYKGIRELPGGAHHPLIQWWLQLAGLPAGSADETPWCAAFVNAMCWEIGRPVVRPVFPARARHWLTVGTAVPQIQQARVGWDIVVLKRKVSGAEGEEPGPDVINAPGHVGFFEMLSIGSGDEGVYLLGGNQSNRVSVVRYPLDQVLGVRRLGSGEV